MTMASISETPVPSPCIRHCCLNGDDICLGCFRSLTEIVQWGEADSQLRRVIIVNAALRRAEALDVADKRGGV